MLFPVDPRHLLWGKNLLTCLLGLVEVTLAIGLFAVVTREWSYVFPAYVAYSLIFYWLLTRWSAARLLATMPEIIERVTRVL